MSLFYLFKCLYTNSYQYIYSGDIHYTDFMQWLINLQNLKLTIGRPRAANRYKLIAEQIIKNVIDTQIIINVIDTQITIKVIDTQIIIKVIDRQIIITAIDTCKVSHCDLSL